MTTRRLVLLCGFRVRLCRLVHQSYPLRAMASSLCSQMLKNRGYLIASLGAPSRTDMWTSSASNSSCPRATWTMGSKTACPMLSCVSRGHLISCHIGPQFPLMLKEGLELGSLKSSSALKFSNSESWDPQDFMCLNWYSHIFVHTHQPYRFCSWVRQNRPFA